MPNTAQTTRTATTVPGDGMFPVGIIHSKLAAILKALPAIGKDARNEGLKFSYRSIDAVLNALNPLLGEHGVYVVPRVIDVKVEALTKGRAAVATVEYSFVAGEDGSRVKAVSVGEGHDWGDKAVPKAMTNAFKICLGQVFAIATEDDPDGDTVQDPPGASESARAAARQGEAAQSGAPPPPPADDLMQRRTDNYAWAKALPPQGLADFKEQLAAAVDGDGDPLFPEGHLDFSAHTEEQTAWIEGIREPF